METLVLVNPTTGSGSKRKAEQLAKSLGVALRFLAFEDNQVATPLTKSSCTTIVFGGDGSVKGVMEKLLQKDDPGLLVVTKSGSQHGGFNAAKNEGVTLSMEQLVNGDTAWIPQFHPGSINDEIVIHLGELTKSGVYQQHYAEVLRPWTQHVRFLRGFIGVLPAFWTIQKGEDYPYYGLQTLKVSPFIGWIKVWPRQEFYGQNLTLTTIKAETKLNALRKFFLGCYLISRGLTPPPSLIDIQTQPHFSDVPVLINDFNIDGEIRTIPHQGSVEIGRNPRSLQLAALVA